MRFLFTTPIYYVNDVPHIGHAYTTVAVDILSRYHRLKGQKVFSLTGTDEHGQKVVEASREKGRTPQEHADLMVENFKDLWKKLNISNDGFIRTTDEEHKNVVQELLKKLYDERKIEKRKYSGWYCIPDERFWTEKDLIEAKCPDCGRGVEHIEEENYFFKMSEYKDRLIGHIEKNPSYILPETRKNEVLGFLRTHALGDLCISRPKKRLSWGIPLPFDNDFVTYVWFDALLNYYSATRYLLPSHLKGDEDPFWSEDTNIIHIIGKDILTTHAVYWSTMLMALGLPLPKTMFSHGWWTVEGRKMSKSLGNVIDPNEMIDKYSADALRYFLMREVPFGLDGDFSETALIKRTNTDLANDIGNLLSRTLTMIEKYRDGEIPPPVDSKDEGTEKNIQSKFKPDKDGKTLMEAHMDGDYSKLEFHKLILHIWDYINIMNKHIEDSAPWKVKKEKDEGRLSNILYHLAEFLRLIAIYIYPFMPSTAQEIWKQLGISEDIEKTISENPKFKEWGGHDISGRRINKGSHLFPRIEEPLATPAAKGNGKEVITLDDFLKVKLKAGKVINAEKVENSNKLIRLTVDIGAEQRQVVAGIGNAYTPEELIGKNIIVVTNLKPALLMGVESQGMLLAATDEEGAPVILTTEKDVKPGAKIK